MDIAALSVMMNQSSFKNQVSLSLMKKTMDMAEQNGNQMTQMLQQSASAAPHPTSGSRIDIKA